MSAAFESVKTPRWGMVIDLNRCVGCQTCTIACKHANDTPPGVQWRRVLDVEQGTFPDVERLFLVVGCQHCADPPCVPVCPTGATRQRADGLVTMDYDVCIGCASCAVACPYQARTIVHDAQGYYGTRTRQEEAIAHPERIGVAQKCTFCQDRVDTGIARGLKPGVDLEATPACSSSCISQAIQFGDFNDSQSHVSQLLRERPSMQLNAEAGTDPQIKYLYTTPAVPGRDSAAPEEDEERLADPANPLVGPLQRFWDWRAAMNWICGGIGAGLAIAAGLAIWAGGIEAAHGPILYLASAAIVSAGLFCVFLKIGRQARFWRAASRPHSSWMSRELYAALAFYPAVLACWIAPGPAAFAVASLSAAAFLWCQAKILHRARGIPAWRAPLVPWLVLASGLLEGWGALVLGFIALGIPRWGFLYAGLIVLAFLKAILWHYYVVTANAGRSIPPLSRHVLDSLSRPLHVGAHALPIALAFIEWLSQKTVLLALAALAVILGGAAWKYVLVVRAGYFQGFQLPRLPQRGSGAFAAPARLDLAAMARRTG